MTKRERLLLSSYKRKFGGLDVDGRRGTAIDMAGDAAAHDYPAAVLQAIAEYWDEREAPVTAALYKGLLVQAQAEQDSETI